MAACGLVNALGLMYHLIAPLPKSPRGIIIDFIGQSGWETPSTRLGLSDCRSTAEQASVDSAGYRSLCHPGYPPGHPV